MQPGKLCFTECGWMCGARVAITPSHLEPQPPAQVSVEGGAVAVGELADDLENERGFHRGVLRLDGARTFNPAACQSASAKPALASCEVSGTTKRSPG